MTTSILTLLQRMVQNGELELIESNVLTDGTKELVYEAQDDPDRISLLRIYQLPEESPVFLNEMMKEG